MKLRYISIILSIASLAFIPFTLFTFISFIILIISLYIDKVGIMNVATRITEMSTLSKEKILLVDLLMILTAVILSFFMPYGNFYSKGLVGWCQSLSCLTIILDSYLLCGKNT